MIRHIVSLVARLLAGMLVLPGAGPVVAQVELRVVTDPPDDTLRVGQPGSLVFRVEPCKGREFTRIVSPLILRYSSERIVGPLMDFVRLEYSDRAVEVFDHITWNTTYSLSARGPDTTRIVMQQPQEGMAWDTCGELWRMTFTPVDTGTLTVDAILVGEGGLQAQAAAKTLSIEWQPVSITVMPPCPVVMPGDVDQDGRVMTSDILCLAQLVFLGSCGAIPCDAAGDVNCDAAVSSADVIHMVQHRFHNGPAPCDPCRLVWNHTWNCP